MCSSPLLLLLHGDKPHGKQCYHTRLQPCDDVHDAHHHRAYVLCWDLTINTLIKNKIMKIIVQRVKSANIKVENFVVGQINQGVLAFIGITHTDTKNEIEWLVNKLANLRIFDDENGVMNKSLLDISGEILFVSNFTLYGNTKKGFRPSYVDTAPYVISHPLYEQFVNTFKSQYGSRIKIAEGIFGAMMDVELVNDGPVTLIIEKEA
jgi:D-tyrosyl-tRNA(Tyr) deacylase